MDYAWMFLEGSLIIFPIYLLGHFLLSFFPSFLEYNNYLSLFSKLAIGTLLCPSLFAIYATSGQSILVLNFIFLFFAFIWYHKSIRITSSFYSFEFKELGIFFLLLLLITFLQGFRLGIFHTDEILYLSDIDYGVYTAVAKYLPISGIETSAPWYSFFDENIDLYPRPYHYADMWLLTYYIELSTSNPLESFVLQCIPLLMSISILGNIALYQILSHSKSKTYLWFVIGLSFYNAYFFITHWSSGFMTYSALLSPKVYPMIFLTLGAIIAVHFRQFVLGILLLVSIPVQSILYAPIICGALLLWLIGKKYIFHHPISKMEWTIPICGILAIILFYSMFGNFSTSSTGVEVGGWLNYLFRSLRGIGGAIAKYVIFNISLIILVILSLKKIKLNRLEKLNLSLLIALFISSIISKAVLNFNAEAEQFFNLMANPLSIFTILFTLSLRLKSQPAFHWLEKLLLIWIIIVPLLTTTLIFQQRDASVSKSFMKKITPFFQKKEYFGLAIANRNTLTTYTEDPRICKFCNFLSLVENGSWALRIDTNDDLSSVLFPERETAVKLSPFYQFLKNEKDIGVFENIETSQLKFAKKYCSPFIIIEKGAKLPSNFESFVTTNFEDSLSGVQFYTLDLCQ